MGKMLVKSKLEAYLLQCRADSGTLLYDVYTSIIDKLPEFEVDLKLIPKDMVAQIVASEKSVIPIEAYVEAIKPFDELGIKAFVLSEPLAEAIKWTNKDEVIRELQGLLDYLKGDNNENSNT